MQIQNIIVENVNRAEIEKKHFLKQVLETKHCICLSNVFLRSFYARSSFELSCTNQQ